MSDDTPKVDGQAITAGPAYRAFFCPDCQVMCETIDSRACPRCGKVPASQANGVYEVTAVGDASTPFEMTRGEPARCDRGPEPKSERPWQTWAEPEFEHGTAGIVSSTDTVVAGRVFNGDGAAIVFWENSWHARCDALDAANAEADRLREARETERACVDCGRMVLGPLTHHTCPSGGESAQQYPQDLLRAKLKALAHHCAACADDVDLGGYDAREAYAEISRKLVAILTPEASR